MLDVGTNNESAARRPALHRPAPEAAHRRRRTTSWSTSSSTARQAVFPGVIIQFEDFANHNAFRLLQEVPRPDLHLQRRHPGHRRGRAGRPLLGAARHRRQARRPARPVPRRGRGGDRHRRAHRGGDAWPRASPTRRRATRCWLVDSQGLVVKSRTGPRRAQAAVTRTTTRRSRDFLGAIRALKPTAIIGVAAVGGTFTQEVVEEMARLNARPIVFALSNPTSKSECTAEQAYQWSGGRALFASRQPVRPGRPTTARPSCRARATTPTSSPASASARSPSAHDASPTRCSWRRRARWPAGCRSRTSTRAASIPRSPRCATCPAHIAAAVAEVAYAQGHAAVPQPADLLAYVTEQMYDPTYPVYAFD